MRKHNKEFHNMTATLHKPSVLILEDDVQLNRLYAKTFRSRGYEVFSASSLHDAVELLQDHAPDYVVLDLELGDGHGTELLKTLHDMNMNHVKTIVVSGKTYQPDHNKHFHDFDYALLKPVSIRALASLVDTL